MPNRSLSGRGHEKIDNCCKRAESEKFDYVWIDTCCIDKRSSAELSEAINSMFSWYKLAEVCYVYLEDVPPVVDDGDGDSSSTVTLSRTEVYRFHVLTTLAVGP